MKQNMNEFEDLLDKLTKIVEEQEKESSTISRTDESLKTRGLEICTDSAGDIWEPAELNLWRSWTGRRKIWGMEYHGPVYIVDSPEDSPPFTGLRVCKCNICQAHVDVKLKAN